MQPFIQAVYYVLYLKQNKIASDYLEAAATKNSDGDIFTIADGMVQYIIKTYLFPEGQAFVGEEQLKEGAYKIIDDNTRTIHGISIAKHLFNKIDVAIEKIDNLRKVNFDNNEDVLAKLQELAVFLDPIDGTAEFSHTDKRKDITEEERTKTHPWPTEGKGDQATICIGFAKRTEPYNAVGGIVYRPVRMSNPPWDGDGDFETFKSTSDAQPTMSNNGYELVLRPGLMNNTYALGWSDGSEKYEDTTHLDKEQNTPPELNNKIRYIISNGGVPEGLNRIVKDDIVIKSGGAGNKILLLLENRGDVYLSDRGVSHWDTCAGEAILEATGGRLCKLTGFIQSAEANIEERYHYQAFEDPLTGENPDPNKDAGPTDFNRIWETDEEKEQYKKNKKDADKQKDMKILLKKQRINPYSNLCGIFAIKEIDNTTLIHQVFDTIKQINPKFNYD
jgi:3'-phosphoadenosine 5'-phosphosulfate (PAPS) 3'-phosphatase